MAKSRRRRQRHTTQAGDALKLILAILLIAAAAIVVVFVYDQIRGAANGSVETASTEGAASESASEADIVIGGEEATEPGLHVEGAAGAGASDTELKQAKAENLYYIKKDGEQAKEEWIAAADALYYFGADGYATSGTYQEPGMIYTFGANGQLQKIRYNPAYKPDAQSVNKDYESLVQTKTLWAYLLMDRSYGSYYALMYKRTTEPTPHQLGGEKNPQYAGPYSMQIDGNYIYYLLSTDTPKKGEEETNKTLYRMRPGDEKRQIVARDVEGYKVLDGTVYYYADGSLQQTTSFSEDSTVNPPLNDADSYEVDISSGNAAYLLDSYGDPVTGEDEALKAGNFTYKLGADGEILSVREKTSVNKSGYTFSIEAGKLFGKQVSRVLRENGSGEKEVISSEFEGSTGNLHYDFDTGYMFAEYTDGSGNSRILRISLDGDVDYLADSTEVSAGSGETLTLYALQDGAAIVKAEQAGTFLSLRETAVVPLAVGIDPIPAEEDADGGASETTKAAIDITETTAGAKTGAAPPAQTSEQEAPQQTAEQAAPPAQSSGQGSGDAGVVVGGAPS